MTSSSSSSMVIGRTIPKSVPEYEGPQLQGAVKLASENVRSRGVEEGLGPSLLWGGGERREEGGGGE